ncbi:hypothetical protein M3589_00560 [Heyndrickxia oleronia]|uniref:hypothetical protein n=1 Tax=Heyndrickxia oleronia TaxID=38875 RepID=UPI00203E1DAD|nr:hypothetical protein [Heyndrickxia oleronia]MCM3236210.1 hypothetical protein [Heyndrickxia oleronia]
MKFIRIFIYSLITPVLSILYAGLLISAILSILGAILRTFGFEQIIMSIWNGIDLPVVLSIPVSLIFSSLLFICSKYIKRSIQFCTSKLRF